MNRLTQSYYLYGSRNVIMVRRVNKAGKKKGCFVLGSELKKSREVDNESLKRREHMSICSTEDASLKESLNGN